MSKTTDENQNTEENKKSDEKVNPNEVIGNPAVQTSGRSTDYMNLRDTGHSAGSSESENREGEAGNYKHPDVDKDRNKAGHVRNQSDDEQTASDNITDDARPLEKKEGAEGKTMEKNVGMGNYQGQQEGGNHGGGNAANKKYGNQEQPNSAKNLSTNQDGDYKGHK